MYRLVNVPEKVNIEENFWKYNSQLKYVDPFKKLYEADTTKDKSISSKQMWCIWMDRDPSSENKIGKLPAKDRIEAIKSFYPDFDYDDPIIKECLTKYKDLCLTPVARDLVTMQELLLNMSDKLQQIAKDPDNLTLDSYVYIQNKPTLIKGTMNQLADLMRKKDELYKRYQELLNQFESEEYNQRIYGGGELSISDKGEWYNIDTTEL